MDSNETSTDFKNIKLEKDEIKEKFLILIEEAKMEQLTNQKFKTINLNMTNEDELKYKKLREKAKILIAEAREKYFNSNLQKNSSDKNQSNLNQNENLNESSFSLNKIHTNNENIFKSYKLKKVKDLPSLRKKFSLRVHDNLSLEDLTENNILDSKSKNKNESNKIKSFFVNYELNDLEKEQKQIDKDVAILEKQLYQVIGKNEEKSIEEYYLKKWFDLLNKRNALLRRQMQLNILENEKNLNKRYILLNEELQTLVSIEENQKTEVQKTKEKLLLNELVEIVNKRSELIMHLDSEEQGVREDSLTMSLTQNKIPCDEKSQGERNCFIM